MIRTRLLTGVLLALPLAIAACAKAPVSTQPEEKIVAMSSSSSVESRSSEKAPALPARMIEVKVENFAFTPSSIAAKKGEQVTLRLTGITGAHGFYIPDLGLNVAIAAGQTVDVTLPTERPGTYRIICSLYCGSGHGDMKGTLVVTE